MTHNVFVNTTISTVKDFNSFVDRTFGGFDLGRGTSYTDQIWKAQMLGLKGDKWREVRATFSPIFTSGKMKMMMQGPYSIAHILVEFGISILKAQN